MLSKLIKYDLKYILKSTAIFVALLFASIIIFNITSYTPEYVFDPQTGDVLEEILPPGIIIFIHGLAYFMIFGFLAGLVFITFLTIWRRFKNNFYGDEAYLTHTLPTTRRTLWRAKACSTLLVIAHLLIVFLVSGLLLCLSVNGLQLLESIGLMGGNTHGVGIYFSAQPHHIGFYLGFGLALFTQFSFIAFCGLTGIIIGHRAIDHHDIWSIVAGFANYTLCGILLVGLLYLYSLCDSNLSFVFNNVGNTNPAIVNEITNLIPYVFGGIGAVYIIIVAAQFCIDQKLLAQGINLD